MEENDWQLLRFILLWLVFPFMEFSVYKKKYTRLLATDFSPFFHLHCYRQVASVFTFMLDYSVRLLIFKRFRSIETKKLHVRIVVPKLQCLILLVTRRDVQLEHCIIPNVTISPKNLKLVSFTILLWNTASQKLDVTFKCKLCYQQFPEIYALRQHRNTQHGMQIGSGTRDVNVKHIVGVVEDHRLREELRSCQHFMVDSELKKARHKVFKYAVETLNGTMVNEKIGHFLNNLQCAAKVNLAFGFVSKIMEDGGFRYFYAHENNTLLHRSKLVCTFEDLAKL